MLLTVADLTTYMGAGAGSYTAAQLAAAVEFADAAVKRYCERDLEAANYRSWLRCNGRLYLPQYPIIQLYRATSDVESVAMITNTATDAAHVSISLAAGILDLRVIGGALASSNSLTLSVYASMALLAAAVNALTAATGFSMTVLEERDPNDLRPFNASLHIPGGICYLVGPGNIVNEIVEIDWLAGIIKGGWRGWVFVDYRAGYTTIPPDLAAACLGIASDYLHLAASGGGTIMQSERIGDYSYTLGSAFAEGKLGLLQPYSSVLDSYKKRGLTTVLV